MPFATTFFSSHDSPLPPKALRKNASQQTGLFFSPRRGVSGPVTHQASFIGLGFFFTALNFDGICKWRVGEFNALLVRANLGKTFDSLQWTSDWFFLCEPGNGAEAQVVDSPEGISNFLTCSRVSTFPSVHQCLHCKKTSSIVGIIRPLSSTILLLMRHKKGKMPTRNAKWKWLTFDGWHWNN